MIERDWLLPSVLLTALLGSSALFLTPDYSGIVPALKLLPLWLAAAGAIAGIGALPQLLRMFRAGISSPAAHIFNLVLGNWPRLLLVAVGMLLAGINMITFMWAKPLLNHLVPFSADPLLARIDYYLFLGHDPSKLFYWLNSMPTAIFYHRAWFALMIMTLLMVLSRPASAGKSAIMVTYFLLWSIVGPLIHLLLPAAGPVFFQHLGYGDRFGSIALPAEMVQMSSFLWTVYAGSKFAPGAGISAMPSMHIATTIWMVIAVRTLAPRWSGAMSLFAILIFLLSISLGWHYAIDGIVGGACAIGCYVSAKRMYLARPRPALRAATQHLGFG